MARSGLKSLAQGLPWGRFSLPPELALKGPRGYGDNRLGTFEPDRVRVLAPQGELVILAVPRVETLG